MGKDTYETRRLHRIKLSRKTCYSLIVLYHCPISCGRVHCHGERKKIVGTETHPLDILGLMVMCQA